MGAKACVDHGIHILLICIKNFKGIHFLFYYLPILLVLAVVDLSVSCTRLSQGAVSNCHFLAASLIVAYRLSRAPAQ